MALAQLDKPAAAQSVLESALESLDPEMVKTRPRLLAALATAHVRFQQPVYVIDNIQMCQPSDHLDAFAFATYSLIRARSDHLLSVQIEPAGR